MSVLISSFEYKCQLLMEVIFYLQKYNTALYWSIAFYFLELLERNRIEMYTGWYTSIIRYPKTLIHKPFTEGVIFIFIWYSH